MLFFNKLVGCYFFYWVVFLDSL